MLNTALTAVRMAAASRFQVSSSSPLVRSTRSWSGELSGEDDEIVAFGAEVRITPGYTNRITKSAVVARAASTSLRPLPDFGASSTGAGIAFAGAAFGGAGAGG